MLGLGARHVSFFVAVACLAIAPVMAQPAVTAVPKDADACGSSDTLSAWAEAQEKKDKKLVVPREFVRVSADLDDFCRDKEFGKAQVALDWLNTCIKNYRKPYKLGFCQRSERYFCGVAPDSDGCKKK